MRFDLVTIFPEYFEPLNLSLLGKAQEDGNLEIHTHNLRDWASGKHLAVDDSPAGGGAGMVMRADVWGRAVDDLLGVELPVPAVGNPRRVVAVPTPSGTPLKQSTLEDLADASQIIVACGRYEGIDARVADFYRDSETDVEVLEFSLGDYVLNGGEVAALALVEGVSRLLSGVIGNPESLVEESHSESGLLEYPVFTQPRSWREIDIPEVLRSGNHALINRWRRDQALRRTARRRPDMVWELVARPRDERGRPEGLDSKDLQALAAFGYLLVPEPGRVTFEALTPVEGTSSPLPDKQYQAVAQTAANTFPLACPPGTPEDAISDFIRENLSAQTLRSNVEDEGARICVARVKPPTPPWVNPSELGVDEDAQIAAYTLILPTVPEDLVGDLDAPVYLSKCYTEAQFHGSGISAALVDFALRDAEAAWGPRPVVLGTNVGNKRATRFYRNLGFRKFGTRIFEVGGTLHHDNVFVLDITGSNRLFGR